MLESDVDAAYKLIREFKAGLIADHDPVSETDQRLIRLLCDDLGITADGLVFGEQVLMVAEADSVWNKQTQKCMSDYYALQELGNAAEADAVRKSFLSECPSFWYRGFVERL